MIDLTRSRSQLKAWLISNNCSGFGLIEIILAVAVMSIVMTSLIGGLVYQYQATALSEVRTQAQILADEGVEAVRSIRDDDFALVTAGTHGLAQTSEWALSGSSESVDAFTRTITIADLDAVTKEVVATVSWEKPRSGEVTLGSVLTNWREAISVAVSWDDPALFSQVDLSGSTDGLKVAQQGDYLFIVKDGGNPDFFVVDISTPASPIVVGTESLPGSVDDVVVDGNYAYVASSSNSNEVIVVDISTPSLPSQANSVNLPGSANAFAIALEGGYLYVTRDSSSQDELYLLATTVPSLPVLVGSIELGADANAVVVSGNYAYVASDDNSEELQVIDVSVPASLSQIGSLNLSGGDNANAIAIDGTTVLIGRQGNSAVHSIDVSIPSSPSELHSVTVGGNVWDIALDTVHDLAFVASESASAEMTIVDYTTPTSLSIKSVYDASDDLKGVTYDASNDRAYLIGDADGQELLLFEPGSP